MTPLPDGPPPRPGRRMLLRSALAAVLIVLFTAGATATATLLTLDDVLDGPPRDHPLPEIHGPAPEPGEPQTVLLLGSDHRWADGKDDRPRSDTMMLVRVDPGQEATTVLSIPRDLRVGIPGHGVRKINDAYGLGGAELAVKTVESLTGLKIHHVVNVNFRGFREAVDLFDCFYVDVDRRYYHSNVGVPIGQRYDAIDVQSGYQRLCGHDALDYVRYRHADSDIVRAARQQDFLRAAKDQVSTSALIDDLGKLGRIVVRATETDAGLVSNAGFLRFAKLALASADNPVRQVPFPATFVREERGDYVEVSPAALARAVDRLMHGGGRAATKPARASRRRGSVRAAQLVEARERGAEVAARLKRRRRGGARVPLGFPLRFPSHLTPVAHFPEEGSRVYALRDRAGTRHTAYRLVIAENVADGQYYGVQGTTWRNPPLLANPSAVRRVKGRRLELFRAGQRLRFVAWRTEHAAYWISNTVGLELSNDEMLALAASLTTR